MERRHVVRIAFIFAVLLTIGGLANAYLMYAATPGEPQAAASTTPTAPASSNETLIAVTTSPRPTSEADLLVFNGDGNVVYRDTRLDRYFDVEPVPGTRATLMYVGQFAATDACPRKENHPYRRYCRRQIVETVNVSTGERTRLLDRRAGGSWHDVDLVHNGSALLVGDNARDTVYVIDLDTGLVTWG